MVKVQTEDFDVGMVLAAMRHGNPSIGAMVSFVGLVRDLNDNASVTTLTLEHYPDMTEKSLQAIVDQAKHRWELLDVVVIHRVGTLKPTDQIVLVVVTSAHRQAAFLACEFVMDYLKTQAPFWKKETSPQGAHWVEAKTSDDEAQARWTQ
ncbi:MAG: molybdenum cofactor biosynthesis protein MoaE [Methylophilales bacterium 28-44-11]|nr:MAG: molybdenum cofactor biosynthesis protein MoaE [Methylophilales bacterium 28-44-11]